MLLEEGEGGGVGELGVVLEGEGADDVVVLVEGAGPADVLEGGVAIQVGRVHQGLEEGVLGEETLVVHVDEGEHGLSDGLALQPLHLQG